MDVGLGISLLLGAGGNASHHDSPAHTGTVSELAAVRVVGLVGAALFATAALVAPLALLARKNRHLAAGAGRPAEHITVTLPQPLTRLMLALGLLAAGWFFAPLNALVWDGGSVARVAFNALVWYTFLLELADYYGVQEPVRSGTYALYVFVLLAFLALATLGGGVARLTALIAAAPLAALVLMTAALWGAHRCRAVVPTPRTARDVRYGQGVLAGLAVLGLYTLVTEACSAEYGGAMPLLGGFVAMLLGHAGLCVLWAAIAIAPAPDNPDDAIETAIAHHEHYAKHGLLDAPVAAAASAAGGDTNALLQTHIDTTRFGGGSDD